MGTGKEIKKGLTRGKVNGLSADRVESCGSGGGVWCHTPRFSAFSGAIVTWTPKPIAVSGVIRYLMGQLVNYCCIILLKDPERIVR